MERAGYGGSQRDRMFSTRQKISDYARYKGVMTLFHEKCFDLREVCHFRLCNVFAYFVFFLLRQRGLDDCNNLILYIFAA